jgi:hypothetical protein
MVCGRLNGSSYVTGDSDETTQVMQDRQCSQLNKSIDYFKFLARIQLIIPVKAV